MKVLWLTFTVFPEAIELYSGKKEHRGSGGWLFGSANELLNSNNEIELRVAMVADCFSEYKVLKGDRIQYYAIPAGKGFDKFHHDYDRYWKSITEEFKPDVVHVHGIETSIALSYITVCGNKNVVCSLQGLPNIMARYHLQGLSRSEIYRSTTIRDIIRLESFLSIQTANKKKTFMIEETMRVCKFFIGRTEWDKAHLWAVNPTAQYYFCNETLRASFYRNKWVYEKCTPHTIFLSAMKGIRFLLKALPLVLREYPDVKVMVATGGNLYNPSTKKRLMMTGHENYIRKLIHSNHLEKVVTFLGPLTENQMIEHYLKTNVFVNPSTCENSSNSVGEAQILGVPLVASYVGGMHDLIPNKECGRLYRCEEYEMLARYICETFEESPSFDNTIMRQVAFARHNTINNAKRTIEIYRLIHNIQ